MNVGDIMTQEVVSIGPDATVADAANLMLRENISGLPVVGANHGLLGIITEGDLLRRVEIETSKQRPRWLEFFMNPGTLATEYVHSHSRKIADIMTRDVVVTAETMPLDRAVEMMERHGVKRLPVMREGKVVGILGRANLLRALAVNPPAAPIRGGDRFIREQLEEELAKRSWKTRLTQIMVKDGIVDIWGYVTDERHRIAILVAAENIPDVKKVRDHIAWVEPVSGIVVDTGKDSRRDLLH